MIFEVDFECRDIPSSSASQFVEFEARKRAVSNRRRSPRCVSVALLVCARTGQRVEGDGAVGFALCVAVLSCFGSKTREEGSHSHERSVENQTSLLSGSRARCEFTLERSVERVRELGVGARCPGVLVKESSAGVCWWSGAVGGSG